MRTQLFALLCLLPLASGVGAEAVPEHELKATYIYNFSALTQWPPLPGESFNICVLGGADPVVAMERLEGKTVHGRGVVVVPLRSLAAVRECQVLYVAEEEASSLAQVERLLGDAPVLIVSDAPGAQEAAIRIVPEGSRLAFEVDVERCRRVGLRPGAALLGLARNLRRAVN